MPLSARPPQISVAERQQRLQKLRENMEAAGLAAVLLGSTASATSPALSGTRASGSWERW